MLRMDRDRLAAVGYRHQAEYREERQREARAEAFERSVHPSLGAILAMERAEQDCVWRGVPFPEPVEPRYVSDVYRVRAFDGEGRYEPEFGWDPLCRDRWGQIT